MFKRVTQVEVQEVLSYFARDYKNCLYSYIDLKKYSLENPNLELHADRKADGTLSCVLTKYYGGVNVFSHENTLDVEATVQMLKELKPTMVNAPADTIAMLRVPLEETDSESEYEYEQGFVTELRACPAGDMVFSEVEVAGAGDVPEIARLICTDEGLGGTYEPEGFAKQLLERYEDDFGRYYCIRQNGRIVCHAGTYAEVDNLAVISGVITAEDCRGQNLAYKVVSKLGKDLLDEGKLPCLFYYTKSAARLYEKVGFESGSPWAKLIRKQG